MGRPARRTVLYMPSPTSRSGCPHSTAGAPPPRRPARRPPLRRGAGVLAEQAGLPFLSGSSGATTTVEFTRYTPAGIRSVRPELCAAFTAFCSAGASSWTPSPTAPNSRASSCSPAGPAGGEAPPPTASSCEDASAASSRAPTMMARGVPCGRGMLAWLMEGSKNRRHR